MTTRQRVLASAIEPSSSREMVPASAQPFPRNVPLQMGSGRLPEGGQGANANMKPNSIFDGPRGSGSPLQEVKIFSLGQRGQAQAPNPQVRAQVRPQRPTIVAHAVLGQEDPPTQPAATQPQVEQIIKRELSPSGITKSEAADIAAALNLGIEDSVLALAEGEECLGIDSAAIADARKVRDRLAGFSVSGNPDSRLDVPVDALELIERVLECSNLHQAVASAKDSSKFAFIAGGLVIGAVILVVATS